MRKPVANGYITSGFGKRILDGKEQFHPGIDIGSKETHVVIQAAYSGVVANLGYSNTLGNRVWVKNDVGYYAVYAHMESINSKLKIGDRIQEGDFVGIMGNTGMSKGRHLHFELRTSPVLGAKSINPVEITNLYKNES